MVKAVLLRQDLAEIIKNENGIKVVENALNVIGFKDIKHNLAISQKQEMFDQVLDKLLPVTSNTQVKMKSDKDQENHVNPGVSIFFNQKNNHLFQLLTQPTHAILGKSVSEEAGVDDRYSRRLVEFIDLNQDELFKSKLVRKRIGYIFKYFERRNDTTALRDLKTIIIKSKDQNHVRIVEKRNTNSKHH